MRFAGVLPEQGDGSLEAINRLLGQGFGSRGQLRGPALLSFRHRRIDTGRAGGRLAGLGTG